jgi:hypothetical protein
MLKSAGSECRRAHHFKNEEFGSGWSHGDALMTNVIYNEKTGRAPLIDFEIRHEKSLPATARHADDLLVFLLDLAGRVSSRQWIRFAICFLRAYGDAAVMRELKKRLVVPTGGLDLVEGADQFHPKRKSKAAFSSVAPRHRQAGTSSHACDRFGAQKTATFD